MRAICENQNLFSQNFIMFCKNDFSFRQNFIMFCKNDFWFLQIIAATGEPRRLHRRQRFRR